MRNVEIKLIKLAAKAAAATKSPAETAGRLFSMCRD